MEMANGWKDLYEVADAKAFVTQALGERGAGQPGHLKIMYLLRGADVAEHRGAVLKELFGSNDYNINNLTNGVKAKDGKLACSKEALASALQSLVADNNTSGVNRMLSAAGKQLLLEADGPTLALIDKSLPTNGNPMQTLGLQGQAITDTLESLDAKGGDDAMAARALVLKHAASQQLRSNDATFVSYLTKSELTLDDLGRDPAWAADIAVQVAKGNSHYWTSSYYASQASYKDMPSGAMWALKPGKGGKYNEAVLVEVGKKAKADHMNQALFDAMVQRMTDLSDDLKAKLTAAYKGE